MGGLADIEARMVGVWSTTFGRAVALDDDFFDDLEGDSLLAMALLTEITATFGLDLSMARFFDAATPRQSAAAVAEAAP